MTTATTKPLSAYERRRPVQRLADIIDHHHDDGPFDTRCVEAILRAIHEETGVEL
jgi:hypothetical protein